MIRKKSGPLPAILMSKSRLLKAEEQALQSGLRAMRSAPQAAILGNLYVGFVVSGLGFQTRVSLGVRFLGLRNLNIKCLQYPPT